MSDIPARWPVLLAFLLLLSAQSLTAQSRVEQKGLDAVERFDYSEAIDYFHRVEFLTPMGLRGMAISFQKTGQLDSAERYYHLLIKTGFQEVIDLYEYSNVLKSTGKYDEAFNWMTVYGQKRPNDSRVMRHLNDPEYYNRLLGDTANFTFTNINANTPQEEFGPVYYEDGVAFTSSRTGVEPVQREWNWTENPYLDIYKADIDSTGNWINIEEMPGPFNEALHDGPITLSENGELAVFSRNVQEALSEDGKLNFQLFYTRKIDGKWSPVKGMWFNHRSYSVGHPTLSPNGRILYFASDMPGGNGGSDLYMVKSRDNGEWAFPINLGRDVNTEGNEMFPFFHAKDSLLYFSSDGHPGLGGLDLFVGSVNRSKVKSVTNLGQPFNSNRDDFTLITDAKRSTGYMASNRAGGKGSDDIYYFERNEVLDSLLYVDPLDVFASEKGDFRYAEGQGGIRGKFVRRQIAQDSVVLNLYNEDGDRIGMATTDSSGNFVFQGLDFYENYVVQLEENDNGLFDQSKLYFIDEEGNVVDSARTLFFNAFAFQYLPKEYAMRPIVDELDESSLSVLGQFTYKGLPTGPMRLEIMDELDTRDTIITDSLGLFKYDNLHADQEYLVRLLEKDDTMDLQFAAIEFLGYEGTVVGIAIPSEDGTFKFTPSRAISYDPTSRYLGKKSPMIGKFVIDDEGKDGVVISLFDQDGKYISTTTTDSTGEFVFEDVAYFKEYKLRLAEAYSDMFKGSKIYLLDEERQPKDTAAVYRFNEFTFVHLPKDVADPITLIEEEDMSISLQGFFSDGLVPKEDARMFLIEEGMTVDSTRTLMNGQFEFKQLKVNKDYVLAAEDSVVSKMDSARVYLVNEAYPEGEEVHLNKGKITINSSRFGVRLSTDEQEEANKIEMRGVFLHNDVVKAGVKLHIFNEAGTRVGNAITDSLGEFTFKGLEHYKPYTVRLSREYVELFEESTLYIRNTRYHVSDTAHMRRFNEYRFILLPPIKIPAIERVAEKDIPFDPRSSISGKLRYARFPRRDMEVLLYDQDTLCVDTFYIGKDGEFLLRDLREGEPYYLWFSLIDTAVLYTAEWKVIDTDLDEAVELVWVEPYIASFTAPSFWSSPIDMAQLDSAVMNEVVKVEETGERASPIDTIAQVLEDKMVVEVKEPPAMEPKQELAEKVLDEDPAEPVVEKVDEPEKGPEEGSKEPIEEKEQIVEEVADDKPIHEKPKEEVKQQPVKKPQPSEIPELRPVYFGFDQASLGNSEKHQLDRVIAYLKEHPEVSLEISAYTDSRGPQDYNLILSHQRTQAVVDYMNQQGISKRRLTGRGYGEKNPANKCVDGVSCSNEEHAMNRRAEFRIVP